jgi:hypothetical protein
MRMIMTIDAAVAVVEAVATAMMATEEVVVDPHLEVVQVPELNHVVIVMEEVKIMTREVAEIVETVTTTTEHRVEVVTIVIILITTEEEEPMVVVGVPVEMPVKHHVVTAGANTTLQNLPNLVRRWKMLKAKLISLLIAAKSPEDQRGTMESCGARIAAKDGVIVMTRMIAG